MLTPPTRLAALVLIALFSAFGFAQSGRAYEQAAARAIDANPYLDHSPYTVIVRFQEGTLTSKREMARVAAGSVMIRTLVPNLGIELWGTDSPELAVSYLKMLPSVKYAELDYVQRACPIPNDPRFGELWGMHNTGQSGGVPDADIDAPEAWDVFTGDPNFIIADIDTGVQYTHPDLVNNIWTNPGEIPGNGIDDDGNGFIDDIHGWDFFNNDGDPMDDHGHGTHTSGTIGAEGNNGIGVAGVNWHCKIMALKFLGASGSGSTSGAIGAVNYCLTMGVKLSSNSWGGGGFSQGLNDAIQNAQSIGHLFIAAAGNNNSNNDATPFYPANYPLNNVISIAATDRFDGRASFSNYGATTVDAGAPGVSILSTYLGSTYATASGTSMACPHAAGVTALIYARNPSWTYLQVRQHLLNTVRPVASLAGITVTGGVVNAQNAVGGSTNQPPSVIITSPSNGSSHALGTPVNFAGTASDPEQGDLTASIIWTSNLQGQIGTGGSFSVSNLVQGSHIITATVTDAGGLQGQATITIFIQVNQPPTVTITSPPNGTSYGAGVSINFTGTANDPEEGNLTAGLVWTSSLQGQIGTGGSFSRNDLVVGTHTITAAVSDSGGRQGSASVSITIIGSGGIPPTPTNFRAVRISAGVVRLSWDDNSNLETSFEIERWRRQGRPWAFMSPLIVGANVTTIDDAPGIGEYRYRIRARSASGNSPWSDWVFFIL